MMCKASFCLTLHNMFVDLWIWCVKNCENWCRDTLFYFIFSGETSVCLVKIKVVSITSELISYHFTSD